MFLRTFLIANLMPKLSLATIASGYASVDALNANFDAIEAAIENTLSRDGTSPNFMSGNLDMNSHRILNLPAPVHANEPARHGDLQTYVDNAANAAAAALLSEQNAAASELSAYNDASIANTHANNAADSAADALLSEQQAAISAAKIPDPTVPDALKQIRVNAGGDAYELFVGSGLTTPQIQNSEVVYLTSVSGTDTVAAAASPAPTAYATGQRFHFIPANTNTGATTINISSLGAKDVFYRGSALAGGELQAGIPASVIYDGTRFNLETVVSRPVTTSGLTMSTDRLLGRTTASTGAVEEISVGAGLSLSSGTLVAPPVSPASAGRNLRASIATANAAIATFTADELVLKNTAGEIYLASSVNVAPSLASSGANGLDTGAEANSTWYYLWVIYNGTTVAGLWSTSSSAPTMPSGYTFKALVSACYNDSSGNLIPAYQRGNKVITRAVGNVVNNGSAAASTAVDISARVPPIAHSFGIGIRKFGCTATGAGVYDITLTIEAVSGILYWLQQAYFNSLGNSIAQFQPGGSCELPYVTSNFYYYLTVASSATAPTATIDVLYYTLPVGGQ